jgi:hypothetical protein
MGPSEKYIFKALQDEELSKNAGTYVAYKEMFTEL